MEYHFLRKTFENTVITLYTAPKNFANPQQAWAEASRALRAFHPYTAGPKKSRRKREPAATFLGNTFPAQRKCILSGAARFLRPDLRSLSEMPTPPPPPLSVLSGTFLFKPGYYIYPLGLSAHGQCGSRASAHVPPLSWISAGGINRATEVSSSIDVLLQVVLLRESFIFAQRCIHLQPFFSPLSPPTSIVCFCSPSVCAGGARTELSRKGCFFSGAGYSNSLIGGLSGMIVGCGEECNVM